MSATDRSDLGGRIEVIDIIRGFAVFGICLVNIPDMLGNGISFRVEYSGLDAWVRALYDMFVQTKFYTIFAFLFGLSCYLMMQAAERRGLKPGRAMARRLTALLVIGVAHAILLWFGDILHAYALLGLPLLLFYRRTPATIMGWGLSLLGLSMFIHLGLGAILAAAGEAVMADGSGSATFAAYPSLAERFDYFVGSTLLNEIVFIPEVMGLFLLGMYAGRRGWFGPEGLKDRTLARAQWIALPVGLLFAAPIAWQAAADPVYKPDLQYLYVYGSGKALAVFYLCTFVRLVRAYGPSRFTGLAVVGRMAFTNYLTQTMLTLAIAMTIWPNSADAPLWAAAVYAAVLLTLQTVWSRWWLNRYRIGPFEWVWRMITYWQVPRMRGTASARGGEQMSG